MTRRERIKAHLLTAELEELTTSMRARRQWPTIWRQTMRAHLGWKMSF